MGIVKDFKAFALKGNIVELAIAVIIGAAFAAIVSSLVDDVITPLLLTPALKAANAQDLDKLTWGAVKYGKFLAAVIKFLIIAFILFLIIQSLKRLQLTDTPAPTTTEKLLSEINEKLTPRL